MREFAAVGRESGEEFLKRETAPWLSCLGTGFMVNYYLINLAGEVFAIQLGHTLFRVRFGLNLGSGSTV